jgi:hypothetical protein
MSNVPLSMNKLEAICESVARELLEEWAINDRFTEENLEKAVKDATGDTIFVINSFMEKFNSEMVAEATEKKIIN